MLGGKVKFKVSGEEVEIDDSDYDLVHARHWHLVRSRELKYAYTWLNESHRIPMHTFLLDMKMVDHKNGNTLDNRRENLRPCTNSQNLANREKPQGNYSSKYKGVHRRGERWRAKITVDYKQISLGVYKTEEEAAKAYNDAATYHFGEFALLNVLHT